MPDNTASVGSISGQSGGELNAAGGHIVVVRTDNEVLGHIVDVLMDLKGETIKTGNAVEHMEKAVNATGIAIARLEVSVDEQNRRGLENRQMIEAHTLQIGEILKQQQVHEGRFLQIEKSIAEMLVKLAEIVKAIADIRLKPIIPKKKPGDWE